NFEQFVEGRRWWPWAREALSEAYVFAGDAPCTGEEIYRASARFYALQTPRNGATSVIAKRLRLDASSRPMSAVPPNPASGGTSYGKPWAAAHVERAAASTKETP